jgi:hypothetical protein
MSILIPAGFATFPFREVVSARTRAARFGSFKDRALFDLVVHHLGWQQMQGLGPWFWQRDIINVYLHDIEGFVWPIDMSKLSPNNIATAFMQMGFSTSTVCSSSFLKRTYYSSKDKLNTALKLLKTHVPEQVKMMCTCIPGGTIACTPGRPYQNRQDVNSAFFARFNSIQYEVQVVGNESQRTNRPSKCPFCQKEIVHVTKRDNLSNYMHTNNMNLLVRHMNLVHGTEMEQLILREYCGNWKQADNLQFVTYYDYFEN